MTSPSTIDKPEERTLEGIGIIDCDAHVTEPPDLWTSRAPAGFKSRMPEMRTTDGVSNWYLGGEYFCTIGGNVIEQASDGPRKVLGAHILQPFDRLAHAAWQTKPRLAVMDTQGVEAQILYPNAIGFSSNHMLEIEDLELRTAVLQTYNDYLAETQRESGNRLFPQALLPIWDVDLLVRELRRCHDLGLTGFVLTDRPDLVDLPELDDPYWDPMWDVASALQTPLNFHIGSGRKNAKTRGATGDSLTWPTFGPQKTLAILATQLYMSNVRIICNLVMSTLFDRFPGLKFISAESGIGWIPFALEALEYQMSEMVTQERDQKRTPTEYFREHIYVVFWFERHAPQTSIEAVGVKNVLVETDFPHPTCLYPSAREHFTKVLAGVDPDIQRRVLRTNAIEAWKLPLTP